MSEDRQVKSILITREGDNLAVSIRLVDGGEIFDVFTDDDVKEMRESPEVWAMQFARRIEARD